MSNKNVLHAGFVATFLGTVALLGGGFGEDPVSPTPKQPASDAATAVATPDLSRPDGTLPSEAAPASARDQAPTATTRVDATPVRTREAWQQEAEALQKEVLAAWMSGDQAAIAASQAKAKQLAERYSGAGTSSGATPR